MRAYEFVLLAHLSLWLMVSYCDRLMSVVVVRRRRPSSSSVVVRRRQLLLQRTSPF